MDSSHIFSLFSLVFYSIVYIPQFVLIYKNKSSKGISIWMLVLWTQADALSLFGTILLYLPVNFMIMSWYHFLVGVILINFVLFYGDKMSKLEMNGSRLFIIINILTGIILSCFIKRSYNEIGGFISWITMSLYIFGRFPQIYENWITKTTEGLSLLMYLFTILGNLFYIGVIYSTPKYLYQNIPWLVSSIFSILLDIVIILQHHYYKRLNINDKINLLNNA
jgi:uncharacterized protein with PQ loop repeat|uniref:PQ-loop repeat-containing protein n=1 Tax=viral metagenome TaxID=1070528 RepID=A0A6C0AM22_9ZZZZ